MYKLRVALIALAMFFISATCVDAADSENYINIVNPIRGNDFWEEKYEPSATLKGQLEVIERLNAPATWLIRPDVFRSNELLSLIDTAPQKNEKGLFLEVTPSWTERAGVIYKKSQSWHYAGSVFLAGYSQDDRKKLIDSAFEAFKEKYNYYPKSVGGWWIDSYSLGYMQVKYGVNAALVVSDQYSTDNYQIWGQYWSTPYFPSKLNALLPAQTKDEKLPLVILQWAPRDPVNAYGRGVEESTLSVQPNDYMDFHNLNVDYFISLVDTYTNQKLNFFSELVVGLENSYSWNKYGEEYERQIQVLVGKQRQGQVSLVTMNEFAMWYKNRFQDVSPTQVIISDDPLKSTRKSIWFMNPYYRAGLFIENNKIVFKDIRQYISGSKELCFDVVCDSINFATSATRVLDEVTNGNNWVIDEGKIEDLKIDKLESKYVVTYTNQTGKKRQIEFLPRDIGLDGKITSIDGAILTAIERNQLDSKVKLAREESNSADVNLSELIVNVLKFILFIVFSLFIPGYILIRKEIASEQILPKVFLSISLGFLSLSLVSFLSGILEIKWFVYLYILIMNLLFIFTKAYQDLSLKINTLQIRHVVAMVVIILGSIFQVLPTFFSGTSTKYGLGFWGPNAHDGIWHIALVNQLVKQIPPMNPVLSGQNLLNYHYLYDLLVATTFNITSIPILDLIFRLYPVIFSVLFGVGTYLLIVKLFKSHLSAVFGVYLAYFAGSFGWMIDYFKVGRLSGESAFWSNQPVSLNLNPPFAISLILMISLLYVMAIFIERNTKRLGFILVILCGGMIGFKAYAAILVYIALFISSISQVMKQKSGRLFYILCGSLVISILILIPNYQVNNFLAGTGSIFIFSPFWFVHAMIDSPDRVGWIRLSLARIVGLSQGDWIKFIGAETIGLIIFIGGNLGVRILSLGLVTTEYRKISHGSVLFVYIITILSLLVPLIFIQAGNPWNVIQFMYYGLYTTALLAGVFLASIFNKFKLFGKIFVLIVLVIAPINAFSTANSYLYPIPHAVLSTKEVEGLAFLSNQPDGTVLTLPFNPLLRSGIVAPIPVSFYETTAYVSAFSKKATFIEDEIQQQILQTNYKDRIVSSNYFFKHSELSWSKNFLRINNIKYIYIPKLFEVSITEHALGIEKIFENSAAIIYEVRS